MTDEAMLEVPLARLQELRAQIRDLIAERDAATAAIVRLREALERIRDFDADSVQSPIGPLHAIGMQQAYKDVAEFARSSLTPSSGRG